MNKHFLSELSKLDDIDFQVLEHHINISRMIRDTMTKNGLENDAMAKILGVNPKKMNDVLKGSYPFDLRILSKLQAYQQGVAMDNAKFKIESESIQFAKYKDQYPLYVDRIEKLLSILESSPIKP